MQNQSHPSPAQNPADKMAALKKSTAGHYAHQEEKKKKEQQKKKTDAVGKLKIAINGAFFLDEKRKKMWLSAADILSSEEAETLIGAILRENFRWKKGERKIEFTDNA